MTPEEEQALVFKVGKLAERVGELEAEMDRYRVNGLGDAFSGTGNQTFGGGLLRLDKTGIQVRTNGALLQALYWLYNFSTNPSAEIPRLQLLGLGGVNAAAGAQGRWQAVSAGATDIATAQVTSATDNANVTLQAATTAGTVQIQLQTDTAANGYVSVVGPLLFSNVTSDYTALSDGEVWYRSDTDKFKARANGVTENLATESYVGTAAISPTIVDAKGDIIAATAADTVARLAVGADGLALIAASGQTTGLAWGTPIAGTGTTLTIATGVVTITTGYHLIDTEASAATDDLDTINGGVTGKVLYIRAADSARDVVAKDGTGNLKLAGDFTLNNAEDSLTLIYDGTNWLEVSRSDNGA